MDCGCILMLISMGVGLVLIIFGAGHLFYPSSADEVRIALTFVFVGIGFVLAPFAWLWWAGNQDEKRWRK